MARSRPAPSVSRRTALAGLGTGGLGVALAARGAAAQDAPAELANHPVVGVWSSVSGPQTPPGLRAINAIHADGTLTGVHSFGGTALGAWRADGERSARWLVKYFNIAQVPGEYAEGTVTVTATLTVDEAGTTLTEEATVDIRAADDTVVANFPFAATFTRLSADAPPDTGTPEATPTS